MHFCAGNSLPYGADCIRITADSFPEKRDLWSREVEKYYGTGEEKDHSQGEARPGQPLQRVHSAPSRPGLRRGGADEALTGTKDDRPEF